MKTISQIGKAALSRVFKPEQKGDVRSGATKRQFERTVRFMQDNGDLKIPHYEQENTGEGLLTLSVQYKIWSIELGVRDVNTEYEDNLYKVIYKDYLTKPSHIIVINKREYINFYPDVVIENEDVCIYRVDMSKTDCFDTSFEEAFYEEQESQLPFLQTGNMSRL